MLKIKRCSLFPVFILLWLESVAGAATFTSSVLIKEAIKKGKISMETGILYQVYRRFDKAKLPLEFRSELGEPCGACLWLRLQENWQKLSPEIKNEIKKYVKIQENSPVTFQTPVPPLNRTYTYGNFLIRYTTLGIDRVNPTDTNADGVPDYIEMIGFYFQNYSWAMCKELGYSLPRTPYTINIFELRETHGINGEVQLFDPEETTVNGETKQSFQSYINIDNNLDFLDWVRGYTDIHEFFHAVQLHNGNAY